MTEAALPQVTVRYWAGAKSAAGVAEEHVPAATLAAALDHVCRRRDDRFARVLAVCSFVVSERPVGTTPPESVTLVDGDIVEVLPPFAGGSSPPGPSMTAGPTVGTLPSWRPSLLSALLGLVLMAGAAAGPPYLWIGVVLGQLLLVASWHSALSAPDARVGMGVAVLQVAVVDVVVAFDDGPASYAPIAVVLAVGYLASVAQQLLRRGGRTEVTLSMAATVSLATFGALGAGWAINPRVLDGDALTLIAATAVTAAAVARLAPRIGGAIAAPLIAGTAAGALVAAGAAQVSTGLGAVVGCAVAVPAALAAVAQQRMPTRAAGWPAGAVWPVMIAASLAYLVVRVGGY